jgi:hypothetical protein
MKKLIKLIKNLYRTETLIIRNKKVYHKSPFEIMMDRVVQIVFTFGIIGIVSVIVRLIFNF